jgi:hypothetical protein
VDAKHNLPFDYDLTNTKEEKAVGNILQWTKNILESIDFNALINKAYNVQKFAFDKTNDFYTCPQGQLLNTIVRGHLADTYLSKRYSTKACKAYAAKQQCLSHFQKSNPTKQIPGYGGHEQGTYLQN